MNTSANICFCVVQTQSSFFICAALEKKKNIKKSTAEKPWDFVESHSELQLYVLSSVRDQTKKAPGSSGNLQFFTPHLHMSPTFQFMESTEQRFTALVTS